jgi:hypothetical protein
VTADVPGKMIQETEEEFAKGAMGGSEGRRFERVNYARSEVQLEKQAKGRVHISWDEARRAETERERARQACCKPIPANPLKLIAANFSSELPKLKATALRFLSVKFH